MFFIAPASMLGKKERRQQPSPRLRPKMGSASCISLSRHIYYMRNFFYNFLAFYIIPRSSKSNSINTCDFRFIILLFFSIILQFIVRCWLLIFFRWTPLTYIDMHTPKHAGTNKHKCRRIHKHQGCPNIRLRSNHCQHSFPTITIEYELEK